jgi:hypothetical protein
MEDDGSPVHSDPPKLSGMFLVQEALDKMSRPLFDRVGDLLDFAPVEVLRAAARVPHASPEAGCDWVRHEVCRRVLPRWASGLELAEDVMRRGLAEVGAQLDGLPPGKPKRVYYALSALDRVATRPSEAFLAAGQALAMTRNTLDQNKARALEYAREGTCLASVPGYRLGVLHFFILDPPPSLLTAARRLLEVLGGGNGELDPRIEQTHAEANQRRKTCEEKRLAAQKAFQVGLATALDASGVSPLDVEQRFAAAARAAGAPPEEMVARIRSHWQTLRMVDAVPFRIVPATTWTGILARANRPPTGVLEGPWRALVRGLGAPRHAPREALDELVRAVQQADYAYQAWKEAQERTYQAAQTRPDADSDAIETFNLSLTQALQPASTSVAK